MKVLVIDDSSATRFILSKMMKELGHQSIEARDGKDALEKLGENEDVSLALVDWNMPQMNGLEFVQAVRSHASRSDLKLVMVTTETEMTQVVRAIEAGANEYIMKPFTKEMIEDKFKIIGIE